MESVESIRYETIVASVRPPRLLLAYEAGDEWVGAARSAMASLSGIWGGAGAVVLPVDDTGEPPAALLHLLRRFDPDIVGILLPTARELVERDPRLSELAQAFQQSDEPDGELWTELPVDALMGERLSELQEQIARWMNLWCSPIKGIDQDARSFPPHEVMPLRPDNLSDRRLTPAKPFPGERTVTFDLSAADPRLALMIETHLGAVPVQDRDHHRPIEMSIPDDRLSALFQFGVTGNADLSGLDLHAPYLRALGAAVTSQPPRALSNNDLVTRSPFGPTRRTLETARPLTATPAPVVCVVGDTPADHALAMLCDRLFLRGAWVPATLLREGSAVSSALRNGIYWLATIDRAHRQPVLLTSVSLSETEVAALADELDPARTMGFGDEVVPPPQRLRPVPAAALADNDSIAILADAEQFQVRRTVPVRYTEDGVDVLVPLDLPKPRMTQIANDVHWCVDVRHRDHRPPARTGLPGRTLHRYDANSIPDTVARPSRDAVTFWSANMGISNAGVPDDQLARPLLHFPSAQAVFTDLAAARGATIDVSSAGRRAAIATQLWGSFTALAADLSGATRRLLDAFIPPERHARQGTYGLGYAIQGEGYLTVEHARAALDGEPRETLDRLVVNDILRRGLVLSCQRCQRQAFYQTEQLGKRFACVACGHSNDMVAGRWYRGDAEPAWYYALDPVVRDLLTQHGDLPILAVAQLASGARSFLWAPELAVTQQGAEVELDICIIVDGRIVVGEAKSNGKLGADGGTDKAARKLVGAAELMTADEIVLATSQSRWAPGAAASVQKAIAAATKYGRPIPQLTVLDGIGT